jgi:hypothetical protein
MEGGTWCLHKTCLAAAEKGCTLLLSFLQQDPLEFDSCLIKLGSIFIHNIASASAERLVPELSLFLLRQARLELDWRKMLKLPHSDVHHDQGEDKGEAAAPPEEVEQPVQGEQGRPGQRIA